MFTIDVRSCEAFTLAPYQTHRIQASFLPDFSLSELRRQLQFGTKHGTVSVPIHAYISDELFGPFADRLWKESFEAPYKKFFILVVSLILGTAILILFVEAQSLRRKKTWAPSCDYVMIAQFPPLSVLQKMAGQDFRKEMRERERREEQERNRIEEEPLAKYMGSSLSEPSSARNKRTAENTSESGSASTNHAQPDPPPNTTANTNTNAKQKQASDKQADQPSEVPAAAPKKKPTAKELRREKEREKDRERERLRQEQKQREKAEREERERLEAERKAAAATSSKDGNSNPTHKSPEKKQSPGKAKRHKHPRPDPLLLAPPDPPKPPPIDLSFEWLFCFICSSVDRSDCHNLRSISFLQMIGLTRLRLPNR